MSCLRAKFSSLETIWLDSDYARLASPDAGATGGATRIRAQGTRLPFARERFDGVLSFESLFAIRPPWTLLAEYHRVLRKDATLILFEPAKRGLWSALRDKLIGPGKRVFASGEARERLTRAGFAVQSLHRAPAGDVYPLPHYCIAAKKVRFDGGPRPEVRRAGGTHASSGQ